MQYSYIDCVKSCIRRALRDYPRTFDELVKKCYGAYPLQVKQIMDDMNLHCSLVPLYSTQNEIMFTFEDFEIDRRKSDIVTYSVENNPILSNWYFSWQSCQKLHRLDIWTDKKILFLGAPRLFEYFVLNSKKCTLTLIDLDGNVVERLKEKYITNFNIPDNVHIEVRNDDINYLRNTSQNYDVIFLDPPWYMDSYFSWLSKALDFISVDGTIVMSMFPFLLRPSASEERKEIFNYCRKISQSVLNIPEYLEYDIPTFEKQELAHAKIDLRSNWKIADLVVLQNVDPKAKRPKKIAINNSYRSWTEFTLFGIRWFIRDLKDNEMKETESLISLVNQSIYMNSPSFRNPQLKRANLQSSRGHGLYVSNPVFFLYEIKCLKEKIDKMPPHIAIEELDIDSGSKRILKEIEAEYHG